MQPDLAAYAALRDKGAPRVYRRVVDFFGDYRLPTKDIPIQSLIAKWTQ
jgi:hypothetical protein